MVGDVAGRNAERVRGNIHGIHGGVGKPHGGQHGEAAGTGAQIKYPLDRLRIGNERTLGAGESRIIKNLSKIRARHDRAFVHVKWQAAHKRLLHQIGGGFAGADARFDQIEHLLPFVLCEPRRRKRLELVRGKVQRRADQERPFRRRIETSRPKLPPENHGVMRNPRAQLVLVNQRYLPVHPRVIETLAIRGKGNAPE